MTLLVKDANGSTQSVSTTVDGSSVHTPNQKSQIQIAGTDVSGANPVPVSISTVVSAELQVGDVDVSATNPVPTASSPAIFYTGAIGTASALTASTTYTSPSRDVGVSASSRFGLGFFNSFFLADVVGTASIEASNDGTNYYQVASAPLVAATPLFLSIPVLARYHRSKVVNSTSPQTYLWVNNGYSAT